MRVLTKIAVLFLLAHILTPLVGFCDPGATSDQAMPDPDPQQSATSPDGRSPTDVLNQLDTNQINSRALNKGGIYPLGGQLFIDRALTAGTVAVTSATATSLSISSATISNETVSVSTITNAVLTTALIPTLSGVTSANFVRVLQNPVFCTATSIASTTGTTYVDTNDVCSITPTVSTSKILIWATGSLDNNTAGVCSYAGLQGTTNGQLQAGGNFLWEECKLGNTQVGASLVWLDSPGTTTAQTYKVRIKNSDGVSTASWGDTNNVQTMLLVEIGTK